MKLKLSECTTKISLSQPKQSWNETEMEQFRQWSAVSETNFYVRTQFAMFQLYFSYADLCAPVKLVVDVSGAERGRRTRA